jgi:WD40 repeat protein
LDGEANAARAGDPRTALMLAIAARRLHADNQTKANLVNALTSTHFAGSVLGDEVPVGALAFAPDGRTLATGGPDARVVLWDTSKGVTFPRRLSRIPSIESYRVSSLTFSPDGHILAVARIGIDDSDGSGYEAVLLSLWDVSDRTHPRRLHRLLFDATDASVTFSPNGRMMAVGQSDLPERGSWVALWDISAPAHPRQLARTLDFDAWTDPIVLAFSSDSRFLATSEDAEVILWNVSGQDRLGESFTSSAVTAIAFSPNGRTLATGNADGTVALLDLTDRAHPRQIGQPPTGHQGSVSTVAFSPDGQTLATGSDDRTVILWNVADRTAPRQMAQLTGHASPVVDMAFSPDGHTLVTSSEGETIAWQVASRAEPRVLRELPTVGGCMRNFSVEGRAYFSADGRTLVVMDDSRLLLVDVANRNIRELSNPWGDCVEAVSPDARTVAAWDGRSEVLWDVTNWAAPRRVGQLFTPDTLEVNAAAFSPDGATIAVGNYRTFAIWNIADRERPRQLARVSIPGLERLTFSPDGRILVAGVERFVRDKDVDSVSLWDVADRRAPRRLGKPLKDQTRVALSPVGHILATGGNDDSVSLWDIAHPARPRRLGRLNHTTLLALSPDGRTLIGGGFDQTVFLWDVTHPADPWRVEQPLTGSTYQKFSDVAFSPDGRTLVADIGGMALMDLGGFYDLRDHAVARACAITGGGLSRADWDLYVPKPLTYQRTCPGSAGATTGQARAAVTRSSLAPQEPAMLNRRYE